MVSTYMAALPGDGALAPYAKVKAFLRAELFAGRWAPGALMPSEADLVQQFGVSRMTINRALRELQAEGLIDRVQGVGTFAAQPHRVAATLTIRDLHEEIEARGHRHHSVVHACGSEKTTGELASQLGLPQGAAVFHSQIVHFENGVALQFEDRYVNPACAPDYLQQNFTAITPTRYLLQVAPYVDAQYSIEAGQATALEARLLGIGLSDACLIVVRRTSRGQHNGPQTAQGITLARLVHPGSRYSLQGQF